MVKRILVGLAGTEYTDVAIQRAVELAERHDAELTGVTVVDPAKISGDAVPIGGGSTATELRQRKQEVTQQRINDATSSFIDHCQATNVRFRLEHEEGDAFKLMLSYSRYHDLTIFGLRSVFEYYFEDVDSGGLLERLIRGGARPIIAVSKKYRPVRRVVVAYSGSVESAKAMRRFVQMRLWPDALLNIVTCDGAREEPATLLADAKEYCEAHGFTTNVEHLSAPAKTTLLSYADDWDVDMIVMGNSARNLLMRKVFGETAIHVMGNAEIPLFLAQ